MEQIHTILYEYKRKACIRSIHLISFVADWWNSLRNYWNIARASERRANGETRSYGQRTGNWRDTGKRRATLPALCRFILIRVDELLLRFYNITHNGKASTERLHEWSEMFYWMSAKGLCNYFIAMHSFTLLISLFH